MVEIRLYTENHLPRYPWSEWKAKHGEEKENKLCVVARNLCGPIFSFHAVVYTTIIPLLWGLELGVNLLHLDLKSECLVLSWDKLTIFDTHVSIMLSARRQLVWKRKGVGRRNVFLSLPSMRTDTIARLSRLPILLFVSMWTFDN